MSAGRLMLGSLVAVAITVGTVALSRVPYTAARGEDGELRLAWRWRSERIEECRRLSAAELAKRPAHMRIAVECQRTLRPYRLDVRVDGRQLVADSVSAKGAESDRPLSVFRQLPLAPGRYQVRVLFSPFALASDTTRATPLVLDTTLVVAPRQIVLITMDVDRGVLVARTN